MQNRNVKPRSNPVFAELVKWLTKLFATYRQEATDEVFSVYIETLGHLSSGDIALAFPAAIRRASSGFMPSPGEILFALESVKTRSGTNTHSLARKDCRTCGGTGFKIVDAAEGQGYKSATACPCRTGEKG